MSDVATVRVALDARAYDIHVGPGLLARAGALMRPVLRAPRVVVIADAAVAKLHLPALARALDAAGIEVLLDDRKASPGVKFKDAELLGMPTVVVVGSMT